MTGRNVVGDALSARSEAEPAPARRCDAHAATAHVLAQSRRIRRDECDGPCETRAPMKAMRIGFKAGLLGGVAACVRRIRHGQRRTPAEDQGASRFR